MNKKQAMITAAVASLVAFGVSAQAKESMKDKEKCYGIAKRGDNGSKGAGHESATGSTVDNGQNDWKYVPKGKCKEMGGKTEAPK